MQAPTGGTQASQSNDDPAPQALIGSNTVDKALELTNTLAAIVKEVAEVLNHAPYVKTLTGVILQFIKIKDELKTNKERCREIIDKVLNLSDWIYDKLAAIAKSRERVKENLAKVENSLIFCESTLTNVLGELKKHQARPKLVKFVSRGLEDLNKLDRSVDNLEKRLLRDIVFDIKLQQGMPISSDSENMDPASHPSTGGRDHALPPKPYLIVEREVQIDTALHILLSAEPSRIAILGGGGFGKTTLARAILHDPKIAERYQSRYFLSCEDMTDVEALLLGLASMLGITTTPTAVLASIRSLLALSTTLLCLDNFETPWESSAIRTKTEDVLASIADIPNLSLIITMRGTLRPSKVAWSHPLLPPLSAVSSESARKILHTICGPDHIIDDTTQNLLNVVDGIPLAINLISNLLRDGETSRSLWMVLKSSAIFPISHTKCLMSLGDLHDTEGQYTKAETYFREAAMLYKQAKDVDGEADALRCSGDVLARSGQLEQSEVAFKTSLKLFTTSGNKMGQALACNRLGDLCRMQGRDLEALNLLLSALEAYKQISDLLGQANVAQILSDFHITHGSLVKAEKYATEALNAAKEANYALGEGNALQTLGCMYLALDRVPEARQALEQALMIQRQQNHSIHQFNAINELVQVYIQSDQLSAAEALLTGSASSRAELDVVHVATTLIKLGWLYICGNRLDKAESLLDDALQRFRGFDRKGRQAEVLGYLATVYFKSNRLDEAEQALKFIPDLVTWNEVEIHQLRVLGDLYIIKGELKDAAASLDAALARCQNRQHSYSYQQGNILRSMGTLHVKQSRIDLAIDKFKEAREFHRKAQWVSEQATDLKRLGEAYEILEMAEEAEEAFREAEELMESVREARILKE